MVKIKSPLFLWRALCVSLTFLILWLSLMSADTTPAGLGWDKLNHVAAMALLTVLAFCSLHPARWAALAAFLYGCSLGILIEILQATLTTSRAAEWGDALADLAGAGSAWVLIRLFLLKWVRV